MSKKWKKKQNEIYFLAGETKEACLSSPLIERLVKKGFDVVVMTEPIDEYVMQTMYQYLGKYKFTNLGKEGAGVSKEEAKKKEEEFKPLTEYLKKVLGDKISKVTISSLLTTTPAVIVAPQYGASSNLERIIKSQPLQDSSRSKNLFLERKILEINPKHPIIIKLKEIVDAGTQDASSDDISRIIYEIASLSSGYSLDDPAELSNRVYRFLSRSLNVDENFVSEEEPEPEEPVEDIPPEEDEPIVEDVIGNDHEDL